MKILLNLTDKEFTVKTNDLEESISIEKYRMFDYAKTNKEDKYWPFPDEFSGFFEQTLNSHFKNKSLYKKFRWRLGHNIYMNITSYPVDEFTIRSCAIFLLYLKNALNIIIINEPKVDFQNLKKYSKKAINKEYHTCDWENYCKELKMLGIENKLIKLN
jgi:hypothetical protein